MKDEISDSEGLASVREGKWERADYRTVLCMGMYRFLNCCDRPLMIVICLDDINCIL